ncbi:MAG: DUF1987 domain-containing protein [Bacteroidia bacterium]|nr:DUF1987 domain-containing protein [Bacteroidia bacterium]
MEPLFFEKTDDTPKIHFNPKENIFHISGKSMPDNPVKFYGPVFDWLNKFKEETGEGMNIRFDVKFDYFNTASSKLFLDMLDVFLSIHEDSGAAVTIEWHYRKGDDDMKDAGEEYAEMVELPFTFIEY